MTNFQDIKLFRIERGDEIEDILDVGLSNTYTKGETDTLLDGKVDKITGKGLSTEDYTTVEKTKLGNIEENAEVNNISNVNATDLTDGGDTILHTHDGRYYTETETDTLLDGKVDFQINIDTKEPTGFNRFNSDSMGFLELSPDGTHIMRISDTGVYSSNTSGNFADGTPFETPATARTFAIFPKTGQTEFSFYVAGTKFTKTDIETIELTNMTGTRMVCYNSSGVISEITTEPTAEDFANNAFVSVIYGNSTTQEKIIFGDERHGIQMDSATHYYEHTSEGSRYVSGMSINGLAEGSAVYTSIGSGKMFDEDIIHNLPTQTNAPFWYILGTEWNIEPDSLNLAYMGATNPYYNLNTGGVFSLAQIPNSHYCCVHFVATNDAQFPYLKMLGQASYKTIGKARAGALTELNNLVLGGLPSPEFIFIATVIVDDSGELVDMADNSLFIDWRQTKIVGTGGISGSTNLHSDLTDTTTNGHPADIISYDNTTSGLTADTVQEAIDELASSPSGGSNPIYQTFIAGEQTTGIVARFVAKGTQTIAGVKISLATLPTSTTFRVAIRKNSTTTNNVITAGYVEITTGQSPINSIYISTETTLDVTHKELIANDILYFVVKQIGSTLSGTDLEILVF